MSNAETPRAGDAMAELKPVTQADRDAAADLAEWLQSMMAIGGNDVAAIRNGVWDQDTDDLGPLVQAFAAHRIDHSAPAREVTVEDALLRIVARTYSSDRGCTLSAEAVAEVYDIAKAALSATPAPARGREDAAIAFLAWLLDDHEKGLRLNVRSLSKEAVQQARAALDDLRALSKPVLSAEVREVDEANERLSQAMLDNTSCEIDDAGGGLQSARTMVLCAYNDLRIVLAFVDKVRLAQGRTFEDAIEAAAKVTEDYDYGDPAHNQNIATFIRALADPDIRLESDYGEQ